MIHFNHTNMESLPKQFVSAMRTLFDIMDDKQTGYVKLTDIENRWRDDRTKGLPRGVIESLQKVASHDGLLTFESFCTGLKICLLRNQVQNASNKIKPMSEDMEKPGNPQIPIHRPPSAPLIDIENNHNRESTWNIMRNTGSSTQRTISMPQLIEDKDTLPELLHNGKVNSVSKHEVTQSHRPFGPPKPPRLEKNTVDRKENSRNLYKPEEAVESDDIVQTKLEFDMTRPIECQDRGLGDGRSANVTQTNLRKTTRRREPRRHTLHNGVDYNLLKKMKQIELEKDILLQGLTAVEEAREWYLKQLTEVQDKMRYAGRMGAYVV